MNLHLILYTSLLLIEFFLINLVSDKFFDTVV